MKFAKEGYRVALWPVAAAVGAFVVGYPMVAALSLAAAVPVLLFFRDPARNSDAGPDELVSPADGLVVAVERGEAGHRLAPEASTRISIFMSPLDVHVNRMPTAGRVEDSAYNRGSFKAAYKPKASDINESRATMVVADDGYRFVVVQIAGWFCRRIVCYLQTGAVALRGHKLGLIMFGSRVDLFLPATAEVLVEPGRRVKAGLTVVAKRP